MICKECGIKMKRGVYSSASSLARCLPAFLHNIPDLCRQTALDSKDFSYPLLFVLDSYVALKQAFSQLSLFVFLGPAPW